MRKSKKVFAVLMIAVMVLTMSTGLAACGNDDSKGSGNIVIGVSEFVDSLNPMVSYMAIGAEIFNLVYDPLVRYDDNFETIPCLAESWELSDDQLTWTFKLVDTTWHDGEAFSSEDVKYTYETMIDSGLGYMYGGYLENIESIDCPDNQTLIIKTEEPKANMLQNTTPILPQHIWKELSLADLETFTNDKAIGTGPFKMAESKDASLSLQKNENYFGTVPNVDVLSFVEYNNSDSMAQALKTGEIDATTSLNIAQYDQVANDENSTVIAGESRGFTQIGINVYDNKDSKGNALLRDKVIRQAIEYSIDKEKGRDMFYAESTEIGTTIINPSDVFHYEPSAKELRNYDTDAAKKMLEEAGYKDTDGDGIRESSDGEPLEFELICISDNADEVKYGQLIESNCLESGIKINNVTMDSGALGDKITAFDYDMFIWGWGLDVDPTVILNVLTTGEIGGSNEPGWSNEKYDEMFKLQQTQMDEKERIATVQEMQKLVYDDAPYIVLVYDTMVQAYRSDRWDNIVQIPDEGTFFLNLTNINYLNMSAK